MNPFYFGPSAKALYGVLHPADTCHAQSTGVVLCPATRDEYNPSHRSMRQLASRLARAGLPVLRFDYYGSGDSFGGDEDGDLEQWKTDVVAAITELKDTTGVAGVYLIGLRLGATLAAMAAHQRSDITRLVLWDPVVHGRRYLEELRARHEDLVVTVLRQAQGGPTASDGLCGFHLSPALRAGLTALDLTQQPLDLRCDVLLTSLETRPEYDLLEEALTRSGTPVDRARVAGQPIWEERVLWSNELVPVRVLDRIVTWLSDGR